MAEITWKSILTKLVGGDHLSAEESEWFVDDLMQGNHPLQLRWRLAIQKLVRSVQGRRLVLWCHEDVPLIWPEVVRLIGALPDGVPLAGNMPYMYDLLGASGMEKLRAAMAGRDQTNVAQRRQIYSEVLAAHALPEVLDQTIDLPGWTQELVDQVTENYRADVAEIAVLPGVEFILP